MQIKLIFLLTMLCSVVVFAEDKVATKCNKKMSVLKRKYKKAQVKQFKSTIAKYKALQKKTLQAKDLQGAIKIGEIIVSLKKQLKNGDFSVVKNRIVSKKTELEPKKSIAVKPSNLDSNFGAFSVLCYTGGGWKGFPLNKMKTKVTDGNFEVTDTTGIHGVSKLVFPYDVGSDFKLSFNFIGDLRSFEFQDKSGRDAMYYITLPSRVDNKSTLSLVRSGSVVEAKINGKAVGWENWNGSFDNAVFCISVVANHTFTISNVNYKVQGLFDGPVKANTHYYKYIPGKYTWKQAKAMCEGAGGYLACIGDAEENSFLVTLTKGNVAWLGGTDKGTEGKWRWINGDKFSYVNWDLIRKEPNGGRLENYLAIGGPRTSSRSHWNDATNEGSKVWGIDGFVCEWDKAPK